MAVIDLLREIMRRKDWNQEDVAEHFGVSQATVSRWFAGSQPRGDTQEAIKTLAEEVLPSSSRLSQYGVEAPLISWVSAGALKTPDAVEEIENAPRVFAAGLDKRGDWIALRVEGDSMDRISPPESIIFVNTKDKRLVPNACYIIEDETGAASYKRWRANPERWEPVSVNTAHEPMFLVEDKAPNVIGRVRRTMLDM